jgi:hypothetical protein
VGQRRLALGEGAQPGAEQDVGAVLDQGDEAELREGALATAGLGTPEGGLVLRRVGDVEAGAVQADQPPLGYQAPLVAGVATGRTTRS